MKKVGVFSGTFDPAHDGHVWFAESAIEELGLDKVIVLVEKSPRRKKKVARYEHRIAMAKLAFAENDKISVGELSISEVGERHSVESTIAAIRTLTGENSDIWLLMGGDVFEYVPQWDNFEQLVSKVSFFVALRSEDDGEIAVELQQNEMKSAAVKLTSSQKSNVSSSRVKLQLAKDKNLGLSEKVYEYIQRHELYT